MPRRYFTYLPEFQAFHVASTLGAYLLGFGIMLAFVNLAIAVFRGRKAAANPWGGATLEWECASPPPHDNFAVTPAAHDPYDFAHLSYDEKTDGYVARRS
jgi:cytochrome c oxidase subunit 1